MFLCWEIGGGGVGVGGGEAESMYDRRGAHWPPAPPGEPVWGRLLPGGLLTRGLVLQPSVHHQVVGGGGWRVWPGGGRVMGQVEDRGRWWRPDDSFKPWSWRWLLPSSLPEPMSTVSLFCSTWFLISQQPMIFNPSIRSDLTKIKRTLIDSPIHLK